MSQEDGSVFVQELRRALNHFYDPVELRASPLLGRLGLSSQRDAVVALRRVLSEAITALKPEKTIPEESNAWRIYRILAQRFLEQSSQTEVARNLALGIRQYRRYEAQAICVLADYIRGRYNLQPSIPLGGASAGEPGTPSREAELAWLQETLLTQPVNVTELIQETVQLVRSLALAHQVSIEVEINSELPPAIGQATTFRQALLTVISTAVRSATEGRVEIKTEVRGWEVDCRIRPVSRLAPASPLPSEEWNNLEIARQLLEILGGTYRIQVPGEGRCPFEAHLALPMMDGVTIMAVDDNNDTLQLLQRYTLSTRYRFVGLRDPQEALRVALELSPQIIVLDVMLPHVDGWELMGRLLEHPGTRHIPILICSILPHEQLAATIGAAGFIRKPVTRRSFLRALDDHLPLLNDTEDNKINQTT